MQAIPFSGKRSFQWRSHSCQWKDLAVREDLLFCEYFSFNELPFLEEISVFSRGHLK